MERQVLDGTHFKPGARISALKAHYHLEGSEGADEGLRETPGLWAGILPLLQHSYETSEPWVRVHQPAADTDRRWAMRTHNKKEAFFI